MRKLIGEFLSWALDVLEHGPWYTARPKTAVCSNQYWRGIDISIPLQYVLCVLISTRSRVPLYTPTSLQQWRSHQSQQPKSATALSALTATQATLEEHNPATRRTSDHALCQTQQRRTRNHCDLFILEAKMMRTSFNSSNKS